MHSLREGASFFKWTSEFAAIEMNVSAWGDETQTKPLEPTCEMQTEICFGASKFMNFR